MKLKHWVAIGLIGVGALFVLHIAMSHGGFTGFKAGLGIGRM